MAGLNYGRKYTFTENITESAHGEEGVFWGEKSKKWLVKVKNESKSKGIRPFVIKAQFDSKEAADECYSKLQSK